MAAQDLPFEFMLNALRLVDGFPVDLFTARTGLPWTNVEATLARAADERLAILVSPLPAFEAAGILHGLGVRGGRSS